MKLFLQDLLRGVSFICSVLIFVLILVSPKDYYNLTKEETDV